MYFIGVNIMNILKRLFNFNDDDCVIGLCKFNDEFYRQINGKEQAKKRIPPAI